MSRFDYIKYDDIALNQQLRIKNEIIKLEGYVNELSGNKEVILSKLEECYMWIGKLIRDNQIHRNISTKLNESRGD